MEDYNKYKVENNYENFENGFDIENYNSNNDILL